MAIISINQQLKRIEIKGFEIRNDVVFNYFDNLPKDERDDLLIRSIYIGVLALMEDRFSTLLSSTADEMGAKLESLKMIFEMKKELFYKSSIKGVMAEGEVAGFLNNYFADRGLEDKAKLTGNEEGSLPKNKTGDIICEIDGNPDLKIAIECKFDKSLRLGDIKSKDIFKNKADTAWSQLIEAQANRDSKVSLIVFDISLVDSSILDEFDNIGYIPGVGFVAIVNSQKGDYRNLAIAYMLARDIALNSKKIELDGEILSILLNRIIRDISEAMEIKSMIQSNIENSRKILGHLDKSILSMEFSMVYLKRFLSTGTLTKKDLLEFYSGEEVKTKYSAIEKELKEL